MKILVARSRRLLPRRAAAGVRGRGRRRPGLRRGAPRPKGRFRLRAGRRRRGSRRARRSRARRPGPGGRLRAGSFTRWSMARTGSWDRLRRPRLPVAAGFGAARRAALCGGRRSPRCAGAEAEEARVRLARAELRDALPGPLAPVARRARFARARRGIERLGPADGRARDRKGRRRARSAPPLAGVAPGASLTSPRGSRSSSRCARRGPGTLFLPNVETTSTAFQEALLAQIAAGGPTRFVLGIDEDPREALEAGRLSRALRNALSDEVVHLPPLREREGDVALLARRSLEEIDPACSSTPRPSTPCRRTTGRATSASSRKPFAAPRASRRPKSARRSCDRCWHGRCRGPAPVAASRPSCGSPSATRSPTSSAA